MADTQSRATPVPPQAHTDVTAARAQSQASVNGGAEPTPAEQIDALLQQAAQSGADLLGIASQLQGLASAFSVTPGGHNDAIAAQEAAVQVLRMPEHTPDLVAEHATRLAEYVHTLAARRNEGDDQPGAVSAAREALSLYQAAIQINGADVMRIVAQLTALQKLCSALAIPDTALAGAQLAVASQQTLTPAMPTPEQQLVLANLQQNLAARYLDVAQTDQAGLTGQVATQTLAAAAQTVWSQVGDHTRALTMIARELLAIDLQVPAAATLRAAQSAMEDPPTLQVAGTAVLLDPALPERALPHVTAVRQRKDLLKQIVDSGSALGAVLANGGLVEVAGPAQSLLLTYTPVRFCGTPDEVDPPAGGVHLQIFGSPQKRWPATQALRWSVNPTGCAPAAMQPAVPGIIAAQFAAWQAAIRGPAASVFSFTPVAFGTNEHINITFTSQAGDPATWNKPGGVAGQTAPAPSGSIRLDPGEQWNPGLLASVALHEIGHMLGLKHSSAPGSIMYPYSPNPGVVDAESIQALTLAYAPGPQQQLPDRGTSRRPALSRTTVTNFVSAVRSVHMVWKGARDDQGIYHSELGVGWSPQDRVPGVGTNASPALCEVGAIAETQLLMAWRGAGDDNGLYWTKRRTDATWEPQRGPLPGRASADGPTLCITPQGVFMAWRGVADDQGLYTAQWDGNEAWTPQVGPILGRGSSHAPALAVLNGRLYMFWKGVGEDRTVWWSMFDLTQANPIWTSQRQVTWDTYETGGAISHPIGSTTGPIATTRGGYILLAWKGALGDSQIWMSLFDGTSFTGQLPIYDAGTTFGPGLVDVDGVSTLAWKGVEEDSTIWWKSV